MPTMHFIPSDDFSALRVKIAFDSFYEVALELAFIFKAFILNALLASRTNLPTILFSLVSSDVNVFAREDLAYFVEHVGQELEGLLLTGAEKFRAHTPSGPHLVIVVLTQAS